MTDNPMERHECRRYRRARPGWRAAVGHEDDPFLVPATVEDVSIGGACIASPLSALPGDHLVVMMSVDGRTLPALATVVRVGETGSTDLRLHVSFIWTSESSQAQLAAITA
ncbi:MAG: PilZ domain-containing protein [Acidimicrobiales bacterium]